MSRDESQTREQTNRSLKQRMELRLLRLQIKREVLLTIFGVIALIMEMLLLTTQSLGS